MRVSFLVPVFNEEATIGEVLDRIAALNLDAQIIVVDDGSTDRSAELAQRDGVKVIRQEHRGEGCRHSRGHPTNRR